MGMRGGRYVHYADEQYSDNYSSALSSTAFRSSSVGPSISRSPLRPTYYGSHIVPLPDASPDLPRGQLKADVYSLLHHLPNAHVHPSLARPPSGGPPYLSWTLLDKYHSAVDRSEPRQWANSAGGLSKTLLAQSATDPPTFSLTVRLVDRSHPYPWEVKVKPRMSATFVTVEDVLDTIYQNVHTPVHQAELGDASGIPLETRTHIMDAFHARCAHSRTERSQGVKRVDYLVGKHVFAGLEVTGHGYLNSLEELQGVVLEMRVSRT